MIQSERVEELICLIASMDRDAVTRQLLEFQADFPVDFTDSFLAIQSLERLRHLLFALCMQCSHIPASATPALV